MKTIAYLRVSTIDQDLEKNKGDIVLFAHNNDLGKVHFQEEKVSGKVSWKKRLIWSIIEELGDGDNLIVPEMSRLGRSMLEIMEILAISKEKGIAIFDVKNQWKLDGSLQSKVLAMAFSIAAEIERDLISKRTTEALKARKAMGVKLGRPKGPGKSKLDQFRVEIEALLKNGSTKAFIARRYGTTPENLWNWMKKNRIYVKETKPI